MPRTGNINPTNPDAEVLGDIFAGPTPNGYLFGVPVSVRAAITPDAEFHALPCPLDTPCLVLGQLEVVTVDTGQTISVGVNTVRTALRPPGEGQQLFVERSLGTAGLFNSLENHGTNGVGVQRVMPGNYVVWQCNTGTDTAAGILNFTFIPVGD